LFRMKRRLVGWVVLALAGPCCAHHSFAMFDRTKTVTLQGTVKQFQWTNPHCFIQLAVTAKKGYEEWSIEMGAPVELFRNGWRPATLKAGDKVTVVVNPMRDGSRGGLYVSAIAADGRAFGKRQTVAKVAP
jgi:hypothetical protein